MSESNKNCAGNRASEFKKLEPVLKEKGSNKGNLIAILQKAQEIYGYLSPEMINYISDCTGIKPAKIYGVATFYAQFRMKPVGRYLIMSYSSKAGREKSI